jgi:hypothetical protein
MDPHAAVLAAGDASSMVVSGAIGVPHSAFGAVSRKDGSNFDLIAVPTRPPRAGRLRPRVLGPIRMNPARHGQTNLGHFGHDLHVAHLR